MAVVHGLWRNACDLLNHPSQVTAISYFLMENTK